MPTAYLRKKRGPSASRPSTLLSGDKTIRPSLSLPDLTTPLLDPESWEELPPALSSLSISTALPTSSGISPIRTGSPTPSGTTRYRAPSLVAGSPRFHRPFTLWQVVNSPGSGCPAGGGEMRWEGAGVAGGGDFRTSKMQWGRDTAFSGSTGLGERGWRRKGKGKGKEGKLNVMIAGGKGVGKTSFIHFLLETLALSPAPPSRVSKRLSVFGKGTTPSSSTVPGPPRASLAVQHTPIPRPESTTRMSSHVAIIPQTLERLHLRVIDTPGLELGKSDGPDVKDRERERGVLGLLRVVEERFGEALMEERRIARRNLNGVESLVHLIIYLVVAKRVLNPVPSGTSAADWSCVGLSQEDGHTIPSNQLEQAPPPCLSGVECAIIRRLAERANVLPILTQIDALTTTELISVRPAVRRDLTDALNGEADGADGLFAVDAEAKTRETSFAESDESADMAGPDDRRPPSPGSTTGSEGGVDRFPFAIFAPGMIETIDGRDKRFIRTFAWGEADAIDPRHSDFSALLDTVLETNSKALRTRTREVLYERYRTERLLGKVTARSK